VLSKRDRLEGVLLGTAVGDALGLPYEGLTRRRARRMFGGPPLRHRFLLGRGMISDDTEHACMTAQALLVSGGDPARFASSLAWRLRWWLLGLPAGAGRATLRAIVKLWLGFSPERSGVVSAGNGPAMRAPIPGVCFANDSERLRDFVRRSSRITHTDPRAEEGALAVALAAQAGTTHGPERLDPFVFLRELRDSFAGDELRSALDAMEAALRSGETPEQFAARLDLSRGVSGYVNHTVPVALYCWLRSPGDFRMAVEDVILLGGDTDSTAAIVGGLVGATAGAAAIPNEWLGGLREWPRSAAWMRRLADRLSEVGENGRLHGRPVRLFWPGLVPRNLLFLIVVLLHGFRRLWPPY
jgi:ADP-ribosylglycohydrolase